MIGTIANNDLKIERTGLKFRGAINDKNTKIRVRVANGK